MATKEQNYRYAFCADKFYVFSSKRVIVVKGWPDPRIWTKREGGPWRCVRTLKGRLNEHLLCRPDSLRNTLRGLQYPLMRHEYACFQKTRALLHLAGTFPKTVLARAGIYLHPHVWQMLNAQARISGFDDLIFNNPALAWMLAHHWAFRQGRGYRDAMRIARRWVYKRQDEILNWLGFPGTRSFARIVRNIDPGRSISNPCSSCAGLRVCRTASRP
jgi:hypothetical protein